MMRQRVLFFDLLRCLAAIAVIAIHVLAPYRHELGSIPLNEWASAISVNGLSRWAVPVFIMISGALMLSDPRPFDASYYLHRRLGKVLLPFLIWSVFYAYLSGWNANGFDAKASLSVLAHSYQHETYYHLGFFYYFIPLYFVMPFLHILVRRVSEHFLYALTGIWLLTTTLFLFKIDGWWSHELWLYSGYLLLGYVLYQKMPLNRWSVGVLSVLGALALSGTVLMVIIPSLEFEQYTIGRWLSYKTFNTVLAASMIFILCRYYGEGLSAPMNKVIGFISQHSLGIYLLHPIFLWPMKTFEWHQGHPLLVIPVWVVISGAGALGISWLLARNQKTRWLLP